MLFELLNQMDGLGDDADVLFVLTTNRPELLEPALASRPGRIDAAIEVPLPDAECHSRLIDLYATGLRMQLADRQRLVERLDGVSAAFIKELLPKAAVLAAHGTDDGPIAIVDEHLSDALGELAVEDGELTRMVLGATAMTVTRTDC